MLDKSSKIIIKATTVLVLVFIDLYQWLWFCTEIRSKTLMLFSEKKTIWNNITKVCVKGTFPSQRKIGTSNIK